MVRPEIDDIDGVLDRIPYEMGRGLLDKMFSGRDSDEVKAIESMSDEDFLKWFLAENEYVPPRSVPLGGRQPMIELPLVIGGDDVG